MSLLSLQPRRAAAAAVVAGGALLWSGVALAQEMPGSFADLADRVSPAVVNITASQSAEPEERRRGFGGPSPFPEGSPFEEFFRQFEDRFGDLLPGPRDQQFRGPGAPRQGVGSGFIIDAEGYVVTNNHVIDQADDIRVRLSDGRDLAAELVGSDSQTDVALLKVETDKDLPAVEWGDSDDVRVGDWVLAVGNPFGLGGSVTAGIVSARGRDIQAGPYDDFIQTDAAINRGNSGGPMFNLDGEVIGINTAIYSPSGGSVGIGFAIPSSMAQDVVEQLRDGGQVERGWLGVRIQEVTPELADGLGLDGAMGALVASVQPDSPAEAAGVRAGDVITAFDGQEVKRMRDLPRLVAAVRAGSTVEMEIWREGDSETLDVTIDRQTPEVLAAMSGQQQAPAEAEEQPSERLGARLSSLGEEEREAFGIDGEQVGVVIAEIDPAGRAAAQGLRVGDVIEEVDGNPVSKPGEVDSRLATAEEQGRKAVVLLLKRGGEPLYLGLKLAA
ncbi:DegQ family serine endoprotease [Aquibaculum sediminis]|uniref:DegQ family serine endoprotease n=1 Tax=Aquibaculum sediminis TaxID=3231907 RepID=UPI0034548957